MPVGEGRRDASLRRPLDEARLEEKRLVEVLERPFVLAEGVREGREADRPAAEPLDHRRQDLPVDLVEPVVVHLELVERRLRPRERDGRFAPDLRVVADAPKESVRDTRRPPAPARDLSGRPLLDRAAEDRRRPDDDRRERGSVVVVEPVRDPEPPGEGLREEPGARRGADEGERGEPAAPPSGPPGPSR